MDSVRKEKIWRMVRVLCAQEVETAREVDGVKETWRIQRLE